VQKSRLALMTRIVVSLPEKDNEFQLLQAVEARVAARRLGCEVELLYAGNSGIAQIQQIYKALGREPRPRALVVEPIAQTGLEAVLRRAASLGIGTAVLNCVSDYVARLAGEFPHVPIFSVGSDQTAIGRLQGEQLKALLPRGGSVLCIRGPLGAPAAEERARGLERSLEGTSIRCMELDGHWTEESAYRSVQSWLRLRTSASLRVDAVAAQDDSMARGDRRWRALERRALPRHRRRARCRPEDGRPGRARGHDRHAVEHSRRPRAPRAVARVGDDAATLRAAAGASVPRDGPCQRPASKRSPVRRRAPRQTRLPG
jgi:ABC-type sugar transport system substrate-binding protein